MFIERLRASVSVLVCCPALLNCLDVDVHTFVLLRKVKIDDDDDDDDGFCRMVSNLHCFIGIYIA